MKAFLRSKNLANQNLDFLQWRNLTTACTRPRIAGLSSARRRACYVKCAAGDTGRYAELEEIVYCMEKEFLNPAGLPKWEQSFSQVVVVKCGDIRTIYLSGQVSVDQENNLIGQGDLKTQAGQAFRNLEVALAAAGATTSDVVRLNIYLVNYKPADSALVSEAFRGVFPHKNLPASTWLGVEALALEGLLVEVDAVAVIES